MKIEYRKVTLMNGNTEIASKFVKFVNGKNAENIDFGSHLNSDRITGIVIHDALPIKNQS